MAHFRSVLDQMNDPSLRAVIQEEAYREIKKTIAETKQYNPYAQDPAAADSLEKLGIESNPFSVRAHTHAAAKSIELDMYKITGYSLPKENPITFLFMKRSKLQYFHRGPQHGDLFLNAYIEPKDVTRYALEDLFKPSITPEIQTRVAFIGDTLHFLPLGAIREIFTSSQKLQTLYATMVLPPEAMHRMHSIHPSIYELEFHEKNFIYKPGGHAGASYCHEYSQLQWLKVGKFEWCDKKYQKHHVTSQILETKGANHLFVFQRGNFATPTYRTFGVETKFVTLPPIFLPKKYNARYPIKKTVAQQLFLYIKSVKTVTERDIWAKVRQIIKTAELQSYSAKELALIVNYYLLISKLDSVTCFDNVLTGGVLKKLFKPIVAWWSTFRGKIFGKEEFEQLMEALEWVDVSLSYKVETYSQTNPNNQPKVMFGYEWLSTETGNPGTEEDVAPETPQEDEDPHERYIQALQTLTKALDQESAPPPTEPAQCSSTSNPQQEEHFRPPHNLHTDESPSCSGSSNSFACHCPCGTELKVFSAEFPPIPPLSHGDRLKNREAFFFSRDGTPYSYTGGSHASRGWPAFLDQILATAELVRPLPHFNQCLIQKYQRGASIPFHRDDEPCYDADHQVLTINLTGEAEFKVSCKAGSGSCTLVENQFHLSPPGFQKTHKHSVVSLSAGRVSLTFRSTVKQSVTSEEGDCVESDNLPWKAWLGKLRNLGFRGMQLQYDPNGALISPIESVKSLPKCSPEKVNPSLLKMLDDQARAPTPFSPSPIRAKAYSSDVKNSRIGALLRQQGKDWGHRFDSLVENGQRQLAISVIHGAGGSGKSRALQMYLKDNPDADVTIVLPTNELRLDWLKKLPTFPADQIKTFEKALLAPTKPTVIFDDYGKLPAGYIESFSFYMSSAELLVLTGDSKQSVHHESNENAMSSLIEPFTLEADKYSRYYINATHRNKRDLANKLGVYSEVTGITSITQGNHPVPGLHLLVPSLYKKQAFSEMGHKVSTYAGCQGLTAPRVQILLSEETSMCSREVIYTALSRAVHSIHFVNCGPNNQAFWAKLESTPYLKAFLSTLREDAAPVVKPKEEAPAPVDPPKTHIPVDSAMPIYEDILEQMPEKHEREIFSEKHGHSNCVQTEDTFVQMFSHQQAKDETLLWATIEARLVLSNPKANWQEFMEKKPIGDVLFGFYREAMGLPTEPIAFEPQLWESCIHEVQRTYLAKPINMLKNGQARQSPDYDPNMISLFLKSQWVKKMEKLGALKIKPGQTIASFHQATVMLFGTMARYMRRMREVFQPKNIAINCEMTPEDLTDWAVGPAGQWKFAGPSLANDFTAFDQSQDGAMLQFEVLKAKHHSIPEDVLDAYLHIKTNSKIFLGTLAIMRLTGEGPTFDANTECNIAFTHAKFQIPKGTAQLYAGDDSAIDGNPPVRESFRMIEQKLKLRSKPVVAMQEKGDWAEFCGYRITPKGFIKDPKKLHASLVLEKKKGNLKNVLRSYELDLALAYQHRDELHELLSEEELRLHYDTVRTLVKSGGGEVLKTFLPKDESLY
nr:replicase [Alternanthera mosaic virus]